MEKVILDGRYEIIEQIGVGGMAKVYKAKDKLLDRFVAIKILKDQYAEDDEFLKKFNNEAQSAAKLSHVNIVNVFDIGQDLYMGSRIYYIVMEYVEGRTLKDVIVSEGRLSNHDIIDYSTQIAQALKTAHQSGIIHRDIKPQNILIDNYGLAKVTDFGIARVSSNATITYTSSILGTVHYISPEQAKGKIVDEKSDLYSLGTVMYEMATGRVPFDADNSVGIAVMHIQDEPRKPIDINPNLSEHLNYIIMKLLSKDPANRFLNAKELIEALDNENYIEETEDLSDTAKIPIVVPADRPTSNVYYEEAAAEEDIEDDKEAVYVSNPDSKKDKKTSNKKSRIWPLLLLAILLVGAVYFLSNRTDGSIREVPTVLNLDQEQAKNELERKGLRANIAMTEESDEYEIGKVMSQDPEPGSKVEKGTIVNLTISGGREVEVPDLRNMTLAGADEALKEIGLRLGRTTPQASDSVDRDLIISQEPRPGSKHQTGYEIDVVVSTGPDQRVSTIEVPSLLGSTEDKAKAIIIQHGLKLRDINYQNSNNVPEGQVISQSIASGTQVARDSEIDLVISEGPENETDSNTNQEDNTQNRLRDVTLRVNIPEEKESFNVMVYHIVDGQVSEVLINENKTRAELVEGNILLLNVRSIVGTGLEVLVDGESYGVYPVN